MTRSRRLALRLGGAVLAAVAVFYVALYFAVPSARFRAWAVAELSAASGATVRVAALRFRLPLDIVAENLELAKPETFTFTSRRVSTTFSPFDLFFHAIHRLEIDRGELQLNIEALGRRADRPSPAISFRHLIVRDGRIVLKRAAAPWFELPGVNLEAANFNLADHAGVRLRAGFPPLDAEMELSLKGESGAFQSEVVLRPKSRGLLDLARKKPPGEMLRLRASADLTENRKPSALVEGHWRDLPLRAVLLTGAMNLKIEADADFAAARLDGKIALDQFFQTLGVNSSGLPDGQVAATFTGVYLGAGKTLALKTVEISSPLGAANGAAEIFFAAPQASAVQASLHSQPIALEKLKTLLPAPFDRWSYEGRAVFELEARGPWNALEAAGNARSGGARIRGAGFTLENLSFRAPFAWVASAWRIGEAGLTAEKIFYGEKNAWQISAANAQASASAEITAGQPLKIAGRFETPAGKFASADGSRLGENLNLAGSFDLRADPASRSIRLEGELRADGGEVLWGKFFSDLKEPRPRFEISADYRRDLDRLDCRRCRFTSARIGAVETSGSIERISENPDLRLQARSANFLPAGLYDLLLRPSFGREYPLLDRLALGGAIDFQCRIQGGAQNLSIEGDLALKNGTLGADSWQVGPVALSLPVQIAWPQKKPATKPPIRYGVLAVEQARFGDERVGKITAAIGLSNNALIFPQTVRAEIFGGAVEIAALRWPDVVNEPKQLSFSAEVKNLRLDRLTPALGWPAFSGTLSGSIPQVQSSDGALRTSGEIRAAVFDGEARLSKLEIENPFASLAAIRLDARLSNIDLEQVTQTFSFGRISGILEGSIENLVIVDGQPAQFDIDLHSVERGKEQRISVEALNKITVLSSGASAGALYGGLAGFFDNFGYSKLGFKARLKNDRLTLRGVESRGDEEFLVVGSFLPPRVNVVSHTQEIAFSELLRRLERIKSEPSTSK